MNKLQVILRLIGLFLITAILIQGCKKDDPDNPDDQDNKYSLGQFTDPRDNQTYHTVVIGEQEWFAQNLNYEIDNSWCYDNDSINCHDYGRLYTWVAAKFACPFGWHLPTDDDWKQLEMFLGMSQDHANSTGFRGTDVGEKLKSTTGWIHDGNGTNEVGFSALPGGHFFNGDFYEIDYFGYWWTATDLATVARHRELRYFGSYVYRGSYDKEDGLSVRCVKD